MNVAALSVRARLTVGFGLVCALLVVIVVMGLVSLTRIDSGLTNVIDERVPKMTASYSILRQTDVIAIALRNMMLTEDAADRKKQVEVIDGAKALSDQDLVQLDRLVTLPSGKEMLQQVKDQRVKYRDGQKVLVELIMADKVEESRTYLRAQLRPVLAA